MLWGAPHKTCRSWLPRNRETANARALRAVIDRILTIAIACRIKQTGALHRLPPEPTTRALDTPESKAGLDKQRGPARAVGSFCLFPARPPPMGPLDAKGYRDPPAVKTSAGLYYLGFSAMT